MKIGRRKTAYCMVLIMVMVLSFAACASAARIIPPDTDITLGFAGDINFDEEWSTTRHMDQQENGILDCIAPELVDKMNSFDIFMINNEFTYSRRGEKEDKSYNFRADPSRVSNLCLLGTDIVLLANNHVFDYGEEALLDTLDTLNEAGIPYVGAGRDIEEASSARIFRINGRKIAYVAASSAEYYSARIATREASEDEPGILACYDPEAFLEAIRRASHEADFVVASVHWGLEYDNDYSDLQEELAREMVKAGADAIIGTHTHCIQGVDFIGEVPVYYNLGNFWFNDKHLYSCLAELDLHIPGNPDKPVTLTAAKYIPCTQFDLYTDVPSDEDQREEILSFLKDISRGRIYVDDENVIHKNE